MIRSKVREHLLQHHQEAWSLSLYEGTLTYVQVGELIDLGARDRALCLLRLLATAEAEPVEAGL